MNPKEHKSFLRWCMLGAIGGLLMAAGDWLLGCIPIQETDTGMFQRAYYLSGEYALWRSVLIGYSLSSLWAQSEAFSILLW